VADGPGTSARSHSRRPLYPRCGCRSRRHRRPGDRRTDSVGRSNVCAINFSFLCLLGLLFLLAKEEKTTGHMLVTVQPPGLFHSTYVPVSSPMQAQDVANRVNYARALPV
jgi:hypothetical protein